MNIIKKTFQYGEHLVTFETGRIARQATGSVLVNMGDTVVLVAVVGKREVAPEQDFFPLSVHYQERYYASGRLPGGFNKREGKPSTQEVLISRLIDRPLRPLFPEGFHNEVQIIATLMSLNPEVPADIPAMLGAAAAVAISGIPFNGPLAAARVGYVNNAYVLNPGTAHLKQTQLDLVVAGTEHAVLMVESEAKELSEEVMLGAVMFGHRHMQTAIDAIREFVAEAGKPRWEWTPPEPQAALVQKILLKEPALREAYNIINKSERKACLHEIRTRTIDELVTEEKNSPSADTITAIFFDLECKIMRQQVLDQGRRLDGRDTKTIRDITIDLGFLPRAHGAANFTRGETQALVAATLGTEDDAQMIDVPAGESFERFMLHYNFPPYSTGETGPFIGPKRREIGHGNLAKRALQAVIPEQSVFPYVLRVVSEITESNGSSSMATVCGTSLALMDAGVPIRSAVAGIAMGLVKEGDKYAVLSDILGDEDHMGDMDFKVAGTATGVTALQMDIKIDGITEEIMRVALHQAQEGRAHILRLMQEKIAAPREKISDFAPRITTMQINPEKIRDVIGKGGATIRGIIEKTGVSIDVSDKGVVTIAAVDQNATMRAVQIIKDLTAEPEVGKIYEGKVVKIMEFGAFVNILPNYDGLVHISQIANKRIARVTDYLQEGQVVKVKVLEIDQQGKIRLSIKEAMNNQ